MRNAVFLLVFCAMLSGCESSYVDSDVAAIQACKQAGLSWQYFRLEAVGGTYHRVECVPGVGK